MIFTPRSCRALLWACAGLLLWTVRTVRSWPSVYPQCFPSGLGSRLMGQTGVVKHAMLVPTGVTGQWTATCPHSGDGVLVRGGTFPGSEQHGSCEGTTRLREGFGSRTVTIMTGSQTVELLCAHNNRNHWSYAASSGQNEMITEAVEADVLVVGAGLGGHAAAATVADLNGDHIIFSPSAGSTSSRSTGVVWFPLNHTYDELLEAAGADETAENHLRKYIELGPASYTYWQARLDLTHYPAPDYTQYGAGSKSGNSYQHNACSPTDQDPCGAKTLSYMQQELGVAVKDGYNVTHVEPTRTGFRVTHTVAAQEKNATFKAVIFASGGSGRYNGFAPARILAGSDNTGIHLHVAVQLGMQLNPNRNLSWGLEFEQSAANATWTEKWFSFGCAPVGVDNYKKCGDYNTRTLSWPDHLPRLSTVANVSQCAAQSASYAHWNAVMSGYFAAQNLTASQYDQLICGSNNSHRLATGMIDGKDGFLTDPATMESVDVPGLYSVGTAGSYGLGNTYFGPGATLGWALHSGRLAGQAAVQHVADQKRRQERDEAVVVAPKRKRPTFVNGFIAGAWLLVAAVLLHMFNGVHKLWGWAHYVLAPTAVVVLLLTANRAVAQRSNDRLMKQIDSSKSRMHARLGMAVVVILVVQVTFGVAALMLNLKKNRNKWLSALHRLLGWTLLYLIAGLYWTSIETAPLTDDNRSKRVAAGEARYFSWLVLAMSVFALAMAVTRPRKSNPPRPAWAKSEPLLYQFGWRR